MASATAKTEYARKRRHQNAGRKERNQRNNKGTTPVFPLRTPETVANEAEATAKALAKAQS